MSETKITASMTEMLTQRDSELTDLAERLTAEVIIKFFQCIHCTYMYTTVLRLSSTV